LLVISICYKLPVRDNPLQHFHMKRIKSAFLILVVFVLIPCHSLQAQKTALILIDIQEFYFPGGDMSLDNPVEAGLNAGILLEKFRQNEKLVIHVRHNYEPGGNIHQFVLPSEDEIVISKDHPNAFLDTNLEQVLQENEITELVFCGMQTHMCVEASVRAGSDLGYDCILIEDACTTRALQYEETIITAENVHKSTLATLKSYARILSISEYLIETVRN